MRKFGRGHTPVNGRMLKVHEDVSGPGGGRKEPADPDGKTVYTGEL